MEPACFDFEVLQPNMFRMIRSARSRLTKESGSEEGGAKTATGCVSSASSRWRADTKASTKTTEASKRPGTPHEAARGRTARLSRSRSSLDPLASCENAAPEKAQVPMASAAVLGDATNTYCSAQVPGQRPSSASDITQPSKPVPVAPRFIPAEVPVAVPASDMDVDMAALQPENPQSVAEYAAEIFQVLKREEPTNSASPSYMDRQVHINAKMRAILVDWLVDVHKKYKLRSETLFLAVNIIDRYLEVQVTAQRYLQLVGATALLIAAKYEEVYPPQIKDFVYVTDKAYTREDILKMEVAILTALHFKICAPTSIQFLERYQCVNGCTDAHRDLAQYLLELTLVDYKMLKYGASHSAAASILLSNKLLRRPSWTSATVRHTKKTEAELKECAKEMCVLLENAETSNLQAIRKKYSQLKHHSVAKLNFHVAPGAQAAAPAANSARERRVSGVNPGRRSTGGAMDIA